MDNVINFDPIALKFYKTLKKVARKHYAIDVQDADVDNDEPMEVWQDLSKLVNVVEVNEEFDIYQKIHWLLGLLIAVHCKFSKLPRLSLGDLNYVGDKLWYKYVGGDLRGDECDSDLGAQVLNAFEKMIAEVG